MALTAAQKKALTALIESGVDLSALTAAAGVENKPEKVPYLSCWAASKAGKGKTFSHKAKNGSESSYRVLSRDEAVELVDAHIAAGRIFAVKTS